MLHDVASCSWKIWSSFILKKPQTKIEPGGDKSYETTGVKLITVHSFSFLITASLSDFDADIFDAS